MDTTRDIIFRKGRDGTDFKLNDASMTPDAGDAIGQGIAGCMVDDFDADDVDVIQYSEKRSEADGVDVGRPFYGARRIRLTGTVYGKTRAAAYDKLMELRAIMSPVLAYREIPGDKGYLPMYFSIPTANPDYANSIAMRALVMPRSFHAPIKRDDHGGNPNDPLAFNWSAVMVMRDPLFEGETPQDIYFADTVITTGATAAASTNVISKTAHGLVEGDRIYFTTLTGGAGLSLNTSYYVIASGLTADAFKVSTSSGGAERDITTNYTDMEFSKYQSIQGTFLNRGTYNSPLNMLIAVGKQAGTITVATASSNFTITIPASTGNRVIRFKRDKIITVQEGSGAEQVRRSWLSFQNATTWPLIPTGTSTYTVTINGTVLDPGITDGSHMWFWEMYA